MLEVQYRMHDLIRAFPSDQFYKGRLRDAESVKTRKLDGALAKITKVFSPVQFFDLTYSREEHSETSKVN
jgi:superfamily I DNA and/or RNA helicase